MKRFMCCIRSCLFDRLCYVMDTMRRCQFRFSYETEKGKEKTKQKKHSLGFEPHSLPKCVRRLRTEFVNDRFHFLFDHMNGRCDFRVDDVVWIEAVFVVESVTTLVATTHCTCLGNDVDGGDADDGDIRPCC